MSSLLWPLALLLLPLPWLLPRVPAGEAVVPGTAIRLPFDVGTGGHGRSSVRPRLRRVALLPGLIWILLCVAAARPVQWSEIEPTPNTGRDLMLAVDVSGSMAADDMVIGGQRVDRLTAVKAVLGDFLERREGDRVGLILFGQQAYLLTPLSFDRRSVRYQLETSAIGLAGRETAIGDAIGLAAKRLRDRPAEQRVLILLTDGVNTAGVLSPEKATELARDIGLRIHTIGMGSDQPVRQGPFGLMLPAAQAEIDEEALDRIASSTGGRYFRARDTAELVQIYAALDELEPAAEPGERLRLQHELYPYPLAAVLPLLLLLAWRRRAEQDVSP